MTFDNDGNPQVSDEPVYANQRLQSARTFFLDDPLGSAGSGGCVTTSSACRSVTTDYADYDGVGHYRRGTFSDTFGSGAQHVETTEWNEGRNGPPASTQGWLLNTFTYRQQQEGSAIQRQEATFESGTGFPLCVRLLKTGTTRGLHDVLVSFGHDSQGNITLESWSGGDTAQVPTGDCGAGGLGGTPTYTYNHSYTSGVRSSTTVTLAPPSQTTLSLLNLTMDAATGLPNSSTDTSGRPTYFTYDALGRLLTTSPRGDATTSESYQLSDNAPPLITHTVGDSGGLLERRTQLLDSLGRTVQEAVTLPGGSAVATTTTTYNALGWRTFVSASGSGAGTTYQGYDAFGRPASVTTGAGKPTTFSYTGERVVTRTQWVQQRIQQTDASGHLVWVVSELPAVTQESYDGRGRLQQVRDANGVLTHYHYDVGGRLDSVLTASGSGRQVRAFKYDGRGFLVREVSAEGGATSYRYDARGNLTQKSTGTGTVFSTYDAAGRLVQVSSPASGSSMRLKQFEYDTAVNGMGKVFRAHAYNYRSADSCGVPYEVLQEMAYDPGHGRLSQETTTLLHGSSLESWVQSYTYDGAGRITTTSYPGCTALCPAPARSATTHYSYGRPVSVDGFATSITYWNNGMLASIQHQNGPVFSESLDATGLARPGALGVGPSSPWPLESYSYDSSGNVTQIGAKSFTYDANSRLASATVPGATPPYREYTYDAFGNMIKVATGSGPGNVPTYTDYGADAATNHLSGATYSAAGSLTDYQMSHFLWDPLQQITDANTGSEVWVHTYDAAGERVWSWRTSPSRLDNYALRGQDGRVLSLFTKSGSAYTWEDYVYREGRLLEAQSSDGHVTHLDVDHLGSVRLETGPMTYYRDFWPYGEEATPPASSERMRFTGHERDLGVVTSAADDIDYMHARYYRPLWSRFLSVDSHQGHPEEPGSWNKYAYVAGNPLEYFDPNGLELQAFFLATGTEDDPTRHSAIYFRNDERGKETDLVFSLGGQSSGVHTLTDYLHPYQQSGDPTTAYALKLSATQAASLLGSFKRDYIRTTEHSLLLLQQYDWLTNNCAQYVCRKVVDVSSTWWSQSRILDEIITVIDRVDPTAPVKNTGQALVLLGVLGLLGSVQQDLQPPQGAPTNVVVYWSYYPPQ